MVKRSFWHQVFKAWISCVDIYLVFSFWYILGAESERWNSMSRYIRNVCGKDSLRSENQRSLTLEVSRSWCSEFRFFFSSLYSYIYKWLCFNTHSVTCTKFRYWYELFSSEGDEKWDTNFTFPNKIEKLKLKKVKMKEWRKRSGGGEKKVMVDLFTATPKKIMLFWWRVETCEMVRFFLSLKVGCTHPFGSMFTLLIDLWVDKSPFIVYFLHTDDLEFFGIFSKGNKLKLRRKSGAKYLRLYRKSCVTGRSFTSRE